MRFEIGEIYEGKVTGIAKFGAFVSLPDNRSGLIHISELSEGFVSDVNSIVKVGDSIRVKVISIVGDKINLSLKQAAEIHTSPIEAPAAPLHKSDDCGFEDKLKKFMKDSESSLSSNKIYADRNRSKRRK